MPFRASLGYTDQDGILMGDNFNRMTGSFNIAPSLLDGDLRANVNVDLLEVKMILQIEEQLDQLYFLIQLNLFLDLLQIMVDIIHGLIQLEKN